MAWAKIAEQRLWENQGSLGERLEELTHPWTNFDIVFASGITDPRTAPQELTLSNATFPLAVIEATRHRDGIRYLTVGSVFEEFPEYASANAYIRSKRELRAGVLAQRELFDAGRVMHLHLHTLYGGRPQPHMFLGQMIGALEGGTEFHMSSGEQLREYHHAHDIAGAMLSFLGRDWEPARAPVHLSSGAPVRLADLARAVFGACGCPELLKIGSLAAAAGDNRDRVFTRSTLAVLPYYRDPVVGVSEFVRGHRAAAKAAV